MNPLAIHFLFVFLPWSFAQLNCSIPLSGLGARLLDCWAAPGAFWPDWASKSQIHRLILVPIYSPWNGHKMGGNATFSPIYERLKFAAKILHLLRSETKRVTCCGPKSADDRLTHGLVFETSLSTWLYATFGDLPVASSGIFLHHHHLHMCRQVSWIAYSVADGHQSINRDLQWVTVYTHYGWCPL